MDVHTELKDKLIQWLTHYTNKNIITEIKDKNLPIESISNQGLIQENDIKLAIKLLRTL